MTRYLSFLLLVTVAGSIAQLRPKAPRVTGFFTNMRYDRDTGDVLGTEIWIVYARDRYWATIQEAAGEPDPPVVVPLEVSGLSTVKFTTTQHAVFGDGKPAPDTTTNYKGTVDKSGLLLSTPDISGSTSRLLKRRNSFWQ